MGTRKPSSAPTLDGVPLWRGIAPEALKRVQARCRWKHYREAEDILSYLDRSDDVYFIVEGDVRVTIYSLQGSVVTIGDLGSSEFFGEMAAIDGLPRSASIVALTPCHIASMPGATFLEIVKAEPSVGFELSKCLTHKLRALTNRMYELSTLDVANRTRARTPALGKKRAASGQGRRHIAGADASGDREPHRHQT